jgi:hypothetical protein
MFSRMLKSSGKWKVGRGERDVESGEWGVGRGERKVGSGEWKVILAWR